MIRLAPILETDRLILQGHQTDDLDAMVSLWSDPDVVRFIGGRASSREETWARLLRYAGSWSLLGFGFWAFRDKATGLYQGEGGLLQGQRALNPSFGVTPEVGWALSPAAQGKGIAGEALRAILSWADAQPMKRTVCMIEPDNAPSIRLAGRLGFEEYAQTTYHGTRANLYARVRPD
ncbi:MAG: GNAT family N-acetyltransferase [Caulobacterales bacterium]|nr:GNAT family N-acetyltransferase [Caulobacterales bacterium]